MPKGIKMTEKQLKALVEQVSLKAVLAAKEYDLNSDAREPASIAEREAVGNVIETNRTKFEQVEMQKVLSCLSDLSREVKRLNKDNQKLAKTVAMLEKSSKKQSRELEYTEGHLVDVKQEVRELSGKVKKIKGNAKEMKKILQLFVAITERAKPSDGLKTIRKKLTDEFFLYKSRLKLEKKSSCQEKTLGIFE